MSHFESAVLPSFFRRRKCETRCIEYSKELPQGSFVLLKDISSRLNSWAFRQGLTVPTSALERYEYSMMNSTEMVFGQKASFLEENSLVTSMLSRVAGLHKTLSNDKPIGIVCAEAQYEKKLRARFPNIPIASLEVTRLVNRTGETVQGLGVRPGTGSLESQLSSMKRIFAAKGIRDVILVDDVIFSGDQTVDTNHLLNQMQLNVVGVYAGIATKQSLQRFEMEIPSTYISTTYAVSDPVDVVSSRDLLPGIENCGRTLNEQENTGAPYILPFGNPVEWASIERGKEKEYSKALIQAAIDLYLAIETASKKSIALGDLDRGILNSLTQECSWDHREVRVVAWLEKALSQIG